jgi:HAE1 family hydrophobic/amphiphilic exporter-1
VLILVLVVIGLFSIPKLGVDRFPNIDIPAVTITTTLPGATPEEIETQVTEEIEKQVNTVSGIDYMFSVSAEGASVVTVLFLLERDGDAAAQDVRSKIDLALPNLPREANKPVVQKMDASSGAVLSFTLTSPTASVRELTEYADKKLRPQIESLPGVGEVEFIGGQVRQINVMLDAYALRAYDLTAIDVRNALQAQNLQIPGGSIDHAGRRIMVRTRGRVRNVDEMGDIVVTVRDGQPIRIRDVAKVEDAEKELESVANVNGTRALLLNVKKQSGSNTVAVIRGVKDRLSQIEGSLPRDYRVHVVRDTSTFIIAALDAVQEHLIVGAILASLVVLLFIWNLRSAVISAIAIPASLISTFALMAVMGFTLNMITLLALALAVGIVIDDAVIVLENIYRFIEEKRMMPREAAIEATKEIGLAVMATTISLVAVFVPVAFMTGIVGRFLNSFGLTMAFSIMVSLLVAFSLTPMLSARWLRRPRQRIAAAKPGNGASNGHASGNGYGKLRTGATTRGGTKSGLFGRIEQGYGSVLLWSLRHRWIVALATAAVFVSAWPLGKMAAKNFLPEDDESQYSVAIRTPEGTSLDATEELTNRIAADIRKLPEIDYTVVTAADDPQQTRNLGHILVKIREVEDRKTAITEDDLMDRTRKDVLAHYPRELRTLVSPPPIVGTTEASISYVITGPDLDKLTAAANHIVEGLKKFPGAADADTSAVVGKPEIGVTVDRNAAADLGVTVADLGSSLRILVAGEKESVFSESGYQYDVNLRALPQYRDRREALSLFTVPSGKPDTAPIPLDQVVTMREGSGPSTINRYGRTREVTVSANTAPGASEADVQQKIESLLKEQDLGPLYRGQFTGRAKEMGRTFSSFIMAFMLAVIFMYLILAAQFESWLYPIIIISALPMTLPFALISIVALHGSLNIFSMLGILVLFGVVKKNSILQVDHTNSLRAQGMGRTEAIVQACRDRLRPILMTTIAFVAGMIPLVMSNGTGAGTNHAVGSVIAGGQTLSLVLTLIAVPVFYVLIDDFGIAFFRIKSRIFRSAPEEESDDGAEAGNAEPEVPIGAP